VENAAALEIRKTIGGLRHLFVDADFHSSLEKPRKSTRLSHIYHRPDYDHQYGRNFHLKNYKGWLRHKEKCCTATFEGADGVVAHGPFRRTDHPALASRCALSRLRFARAPLLFQEGSSFKLTLPNAASL
jgi:hypothetical protein